MRLSVDITHSFGAFSFDARFDAPNGVTALFGRSGSGKTSIVNAVAGLLRPRKGRIALGDTILFDASAGLDLAPHRRRVGYVFQDGRLFPHLSVRANLLYGARGTARRFDDVVSLLDIGPLLDRAPGALSGGEKQRVAIGRALLSDPAILLMDEPLAALDAERKATILPYLERLRDSADVPILYVSHAIEEVARLARTVVVLEAGRVAAVGPAEDILSDPANVRLLGLREAGAVLQAHVLKHHPDGLSELGTSAARLLLPSIDVPVGETVRVRIAAQDVMLARRRPEGISALNLLAVTVADIRLGEGPGAMVRLASGSDRLLARITRRSVEALGLRSGMEIFAVIKSVSVAPLDIGGGIAPRD